MESLNYIANTTISVVCKINRFYNTHGKYIYTDIQEGAPLLRQGIIPYHLTNEKPDIVIKPAKEHKD